MVVTLFTSLPQLIDESPYRGRFAVPPHTAVLSKTSWPRYPDIVSSGKKAMMSIPLPLSAVSESLAVALQGATEVSLSSMFLSSELLGGLARFTMLKGTYSTGCHPSEVLFMKHVFPVLSGAGSPMCLSTVPPVSLPILDMYDDGLGMPIPRVNCIS
jgi:hypothetical protein